MGYKDILPIRFGRTRLTWARVKKYGFINEYGTYAGHVRQMGNSRKHAQLVFLDMEN